LAEDMRTLIFIFAMAFCATGHSDDDLKKVVNSEFESPRLERSLNFFVAHYSSHATNRFYVGPIKIHEGMLVEALVYWKEERTLLTYTELIKGAPDSFAWHGHALKLDRDTVDTGADIAGSTYLVTHRMWIEWMEQCISIGKLHKVTRKAARQAFPDSDKK
jgi:hypothetical protein